MKEETKDLQEERLVYKVYKESTLKFLLKIRRLLK